ncbi:MAG: HD domain-containing protein [Syntrophorhabdaceae bacterium]|nr:HD domain-containing protein [Syntrophorhabdaceae bacterium]MDD4196108.1 HD domain-containing protein [Syntrophorhabdaceae bacterium]HOC45031.1 HD domain-containing protein [Syntrophorhabdaceae bacterium]
MTKEFILELFNAAAMQRWNDKIRPVELKELDKQAHKMAIAYFLGKFEESTEGFSWLEIIEGGLFEFLERLVITDLKPQIFNRIKEDKKKYEELTKWVYKRLEPVISPLGLDFVDRFRHYFSSIDNTISKRILNASHFYATRWEFDIIERANPTGYEIPEIRSFLQKKQEKHYDLTGIQQLALFQKYRNFIDLCGQLRFQYRWSHLNMIPRTSVLGHMLLVAILSYLFSRDIGACPKRCFNNYFTGLFHDLPEVLTRDIISPVKRSIEGLDSLIKAYEKEQMDQEVFNLIPPEWHDEMRTFTEDEFTSIVYVDHQVVTTDTETISREYNKDVFNPRDGEMVKAVDDLTAYVETYCSLENGVKSPDLLEARQSISRKYKDLTIGGIPFPDIFSYFKVYTSATREA